MTEGSNCSTGIYSGHLQSVHEEGKAPSKKKKEKE